MKLRILTYTEMEWDTETHKSRILKHWSKEITGTFQKKTKKSLTSNYKEEEF